MRRVVHRQVAELLRAIPASAWPAVSLIAERFDTTAEAVISIYSQEAQQYVVRNLHRLRADYEAHARRYCAGEDVVQQAFRLNFPPCLVIRGHLFTLLGLSKQRATDVLKDPALLRCFPLLPHASAPVASGSSGAANGNISGADAGSRSGDSRGEGYGGNGSSGNSNAVTPALLARLEADVARCVAVDWLQAPCMDAVRHTSGLEGEAALCNALAAQGVPFWSEESLREAGYIKTPDVRLQVPVATASGAHIDWIDSKATFGDDAQHRNQLREQYSKYVNRYGPGAVVYWAGFVAEAGGPAAAVAERLVLLDDAPQRLALLPRLSI